MILKNRANLCYCKLGNLGKLVRLPFVPAQSTIPSIKRYIARVKIIAPIIMS